jgi:hypothetical protein
LPSSHLPVHRLIFGSTLIETSTPVTDYTRGKHAELRPAVWDKIVVNPTCVVCLAPHVFRELLVPVSMDVRLKMLIAPEMLLAVRLEMSVISSIGNVFHPVTLQIV